MLKHSIVVFFVTILNIYSKTWRAFPKYYKSLAFISFLNGFYYYLCKRHLTWEFINHNMNWRILRAIHMFYVSPLIVLYVLANFPSTLKAQTVYLVKTVFISSFLEFLLVKYKLLQFKHGWNIFWSSLIYFKLYLYGYLFTKNPKVSWFLSFISMVYFMIKFNVPFTKRMLKGPFFMLQK